jgi:hypothetical protein
MKRKMAEKMKEQGGRCSGAQGHDERAGAEGFEQKRREEIAARRIVNRKPADERRKKCTGKF